jgi:CHAT domain-containing protein
MLHVTAHAEARAHPWLAEHGGGTLSHLLLQGARPDAEPERFTEADLLGLPLSADLTVLSACSTALAESWDLEGGLGLGRAFLGAGSRTVLASQWRVDDAATAALMTAFYEEYAGFLGEGRADRDRFWKAEALWRAQARVRAQEPWAHPYFWASFVLTGMPD